MAPDNEMEQARLMLRAHTEMLRLLEPLPLAAQRALLSELSETIGGPTVPAEKKKVEQANGNSQTFSDKALVLLRGAKAGLTVAELAIQLYPNKETARAKHNTRAMLFFLRQKESAYSVSGRWFAGAGAGGSVSKKERVFKVPNPASARRSVPGSVPDLTFKAVGSAGKPVTSADVIAAVQRSKPDVNPVGVYGALHNMAKSGKISQEMVGKKATYSMPNGGKKK